MIEKRYEYTISDEKKIEKIVSNKFVAINHMILGKDDRLPLHNANSDVQMLVTRGTITLKLNNQDEHNYDVGSILEIPMGTRMNVFNKGENVTEIFVIKAPSPEYYQELVENETVNGSVE